MPDPTVQGRGPGPEPEYLPALLAAETPRSGREAAEKLARAATKGSRVVAKGTLEVARSETCG